MSDEAPRIPATPVDVIAARLDRIVAHYGDAILCRRGVPEAVTVCDEPDFPPLPPEPPRDAADRMGSSRIVAGGRIAQPA